MSIKRLIIVAVGGQGNLLATSVLGEAALQAGVPVRMSEVHGMAQRGGVVESAMVFGDAHSPVISDGAADLLVGFEPLETLRALGKCRPGAVVISNLAPLPPFTATLGKTAYPEINDIIRRLNDRAGRLVTLDAARLAMEAGNALAVNMVLLGALIQAAVLPLNAEQVRAAMARKTKPAFLDSNLAAFALGCKAAVAEAEN